MCHAPLSQHRLRDDETPDGLRDAEATGERGRVTAVAASLIRCCHHVGLLGCSLEATSCVRCVTDALDGTDALLGSLGVTDCRTKILRSVVMPFVNEKAMACKVFYIAYASFCLFAVSSYTIDCLNHDAKHILSGKDPPSAIHLANR